MEGLLIQGLLIDFFLLPIWPKSRSGPPRPRFCRPWVSLCCRFLSGSCHLARALNVKIGVEFQIFIIVTFFNCGQVLQFGAHSRYYKGAWTQKISFLVICNKYFQIWFLYRLKKSKQTFNTKFVIRRSVQMTWTRHLGHKFVLIFR